MNPRPLLNSSSKLIIPLLLPLLSSANSIISFTMSSSYKHPLSLSFPAFPLSLMSFLLVLPPSLSLYFHYSILPLFILQLRSSTLLLQKKKLSKVDNRNLICVPNFPFFSKNDQISSMWPIQLVTWKSIQHNIPI